MNDFYNNNQGNPVGNSFPRNPETPPTNPNTQQPQQPINYGAYNQGPAIQTIRISKDLSSLPNMLPLPRLFITMPKWVTTLNIISDIRVYLWIHTILKSKKGNINYEEAKKSL